MVGTATKYPFFSSFLAGVVAVVFVGALALASIFGWRYIRDRRRRREQANNAIPIPLTSLEDGLKASGGASDVSSGSPSRLGGISPSSVKTRAADETAPEARQSQFSVQPGTADDDDNSTSAQVDGQRHPISGVSQRSAITINPMTTEGVEQAEDHTRRTEVRSNLTSWSNDGDTTTQRVRPRPSDYPSRPRIPLAPPVPPTSTARLSVSTVWSQESMWPREKKPDVPVPPLPSMPALAHMQVPRRVMFSPVVAAGAQNRRSTSSLPRSVGQSDYDDYI